MHKTWLISLLILSSLVLASCVCSSDYAPVCSEYGISYKNACLAEKDNAAIAYEGVCREEVKEAPAPAEEPPQAPPAAIEIDPEIATACQQEDQFERNYCIEQKAKEKKNIQYCNIIDNDDQRFLCLAKATEDPTYCHKVWHPGLRDACLLDFALLNDDVNTCLKIQELMNRYGCIDRISEQTYDKTVCAYIDKSITIGPKNFYEECMNRQQQPGFKLINESESYG